MRINFCSEIFLEFQKTEGEISFKLLLELLTAESAVDLGSGLCSIKHTVPFLWKPTIKTVQPSWILAGKEFNTLIHLATCFRKREFFYVLVWGKEWFEQNVEVSLVNRRSCFRSIRVHAWNTAFFSSQKCLNCSNDCPKAHVYYR